MARHRDQWAFVPAFPGARSKLAVPLLCAAIALGLALGSPAPSLADQTDERLPRLFEQLQFSRTDGDAKIVETVIWGLWDEHEDAAVQSLFDDGVSAMARGRMGRAVELFDGVVELAPDFAEGWNKRATAYYLLGRYEESLADIERTLALEPRHFGALSGRGLVMEKLGDLEGSLASFEAALEIHPRLIGARLNAEAIREALRDSSI